MLTQLKDFLIGPPLPTRQLQEKRLNKIRALAAFSPDALSSIAYANQEIYLGLIVPLTKPALSALGIFTFMGAFDSFLWPLVIIDSAQWQTLPLVLARMTMSNVVYPNWQMAAAVLSVIPVIIVYVVFQRNFVQGIALTGLKA